MKIAVNTRFLWGDNLEGYGYFLLETFSRIARAHPEHEFIFIFDRPFDQKFVFSGNITPVVAGPPARHPILWKFWYDFRIPALLRKYKADVFVSCDGFCSLRTRVPQCLVVHDLSFLHYPAFIHRSHNFFYRRYTPKFLKKAATVATVSEFSKQDIIRHYKIAPEKLSVVPNGVKEIFHPRAAAEKDTIKSAYTDGKEFFLYTGAIHPRKNLMNLLRAFSLFKKRQQSNWKLILAGRLAWKYKHFTESLKTYKYRNDVVMTGYLEEEKLAALTGAAYAMVYPSLWEGFGVPVLEAMRSDVPVITSSNSAMQTIAGDAALYADPSNHEDLAAKMMLLYKDERLRSQLIEKGQAISKEYSWDKSAELLWEVIQKTAR